MKNTAQVEVDSEQIIKEALADLDKKFGKGTVIRLGDGLVEASAKPIPTECLSLDLALGIGGLPQGRIVEIFGPESGGKSTLALHVVASVQKMGRLAAFIDVEHTLDVLYAERLGVNMDSLLFSQPSSGEEALDIVERLAETGQLGVIVVDSVAALVPQAEIDGKMGDAHVGIKARLMGQALRKITPLARKTNTCVVFINQIRHKIGVFFGSPETTPGGLALRYHASARLEIRKITPIKEGDQVIGARTRIKVKKNKVSRPFTECEFDLIYGEGISREGDILDLCVRYDVVDKKGAWFAYKDENFGQGRPKAVKYLKDNKDFTNDLASEVTIKIKETLKKLKN